MFCRDNKLSPSKPTVPIHFRENTSQKIYMTRAPCTKLDLFTGPPNLPTKPRSARLARTLTPPAAPARASGRSPRRARRVPRAPRDTWKPWRPRAIPARGPWTRRRKGSEGDVWGIKVATTASKATTCHHHKKHHKMSSAPTKYTPFYQGENATNLSF